MRTGSQVKIEIGSPTGTSFVDWTSRCIFSRCRFELASNAMPGMFEIVVEDRAQTASFTTGATIRLTIDGVVMFGGFVRTIGRTFAFPVDDTSVIANVDSRLWVLRGVDYNILFDTRVLRRTSDYVHKIPDLPGNTHDGDALRMMFGSYADMPTAFSASQIQNVGYLIFLDSEQEVDGIPVPYPDASKAWAWRVQGTKLRDQIAEIAELNAALFWIDGEMRCWYIAQETAEMPWGFSDVPSYRPIVNGTDGFGKGANVPFATIGFRDLDATEDGSSIVTDALIWGGKALTSGNILFARIQNAVTGPTQRSSQIFVQTGDPKAGTPLEQYGRWQRGEVHVGQDGYGTLTNVRLRAKHIVSGLTGVAGGEERGLSKPQWSIGLTWFAHEVPLLDGEPFHVRPGYFMNFLLYTFGTTSEQSGITVRKPLWKTLPVRSISITFPTLDPEGNGYVQFSGQFSLSTDDPFNYWRYIRDRAASTDTSMYILPVTGDSDSTEYGAPAEMAPFEAPDGSRTDFSLRLANGVEVGYIGGSLSVYVSGILQARGTQAVELSPADGTFRITLPPPAGAQIIARFTALAAG